MITKELINPKSIVIVGGSNDIQKPGGKALKNLIDQGFGGKIYVVNPKADEVQGIKSYRDPHDLPQVDLAILAIPAAFCPDTIELLAKEKGTKAFIVFSAGFSEENEEGARLEKRMVQIVNQYGASLIGPNCIGVINTNYAGVFTTPIPKLDPRGIDMISGSGATAVFIMESALPKGLTFNSIWSVGNSAQIGVEEVLEYMDLSFDPDRDPKVKLLYIEKIENPQKFLKHTQSLINKGCRIAAVKAGSSEAGSRAASSHTGALASSDEAVSALFRKAGIVRCQGREELATVAAIFQQKEMQGDSVAVVTHAGGPGVMLTDALSNGGMKVPPIDKDIQKDLLENLFPGSSAANPIDFLATGTAQQLDYILETCEEKCDNIHAIAVIFGTPGLFRVFDAYDVIHKHIEKNKKPIYPIMPSTSEAAEEIKHFQGYGHQSFNDEVLFGQALVKVWKTPKPSSLDVSTPEDMDKNTIKQIIANAHDGYLNPEQVSALLDAAGITRVPEAVVTTQEQALSKANEFGYPLVMKVVGPVHKSDVGGVVLGVENQDQVKEHFSQLMQIPDAKGVLLQPMAKGIELFVGAKKEPKFGHIVLAGLGGIFIEVLKDVQSGLAPISTDEAMLMINSLKGVKMLEGARGTKPVDKKRFADIISRVSLLCQSAPEIAEMDINPLLSDGERILAVDARIRIEK